MMWDLTLLHAKLTGRCQITKLAETELHVSKLNCVNCVSQNEEEHKGRDQWYVARFAADDAPDYNVGQYIRTNAAGPSYRTVVLQAEVSREKVPLRNAYKHVGQRASVRVNSGPTRELTCKALNSVATLNYRTDRVNLFWLLSLTTSIAAVSSPPFPPSINEDALFKARNDISAGEIKIFKEVLSVAAEIHVLLGEKEAEEVYNLTEDDRVEIGPFVVGASDLL